MVQAGLTLSNVRRNVNGAKVQPGQEVAIAYQLFRQCEPSIIVTSAPADDPFKFILGGNAVIRGFEMAVEQLSVGDKATAHVSSELAYGKIGQPPDILDDEDLIIQLEVVSARNVD